MECAHLDIWPIPISKAKIPVCRKVVRSYGKSFYSPTIFQIQEYCRTGEHTRCPFYLRNNENGNIEPIIPHKEQSEAPKKNAA